MKEVYFSTDVETDGPIPGPNSLLSLGSAAYLPGGTLLGTFEVNLEPLPGANADPDTAAWWAERPEAWEVCRQNPVSPHDGMQRFADWIESFRSSPVFVAYPAGFDFMFVYWYLIRFAGRSPFSFSALDMKTYAACLLDKPYRSVSKKHMPKSWFDPGLKHTHRAVDDAIEQGWTFIQMLKSRKEMTGGR